MPWGLATAAGGGGGRVQVPENWTVKARPKVYLCGPINGCTDAEAKDWRNAVKRHFPDALDPMRRDYRGKEAESYREIVELDKRDVEAADVILVNYDKPSVGTSMEILWAWLKETPIIL